MKLKSGHEEYFFSMVYDDGFWYTLTHGQPPQNTDDLLLVNAYDAKKVMDAIQVLKEYEKACELEGKKYTEILIEER
jgi:hypothetical protein